MSGRQLCARQIHFYVPCNPRGLTPDRHKVQMDGGEVEVIVAIDRTGSGLGTEAAEFTRASGRFKGVSFDQGDYFKLVYAPEHHHFLRHFAVLFDAPIEGACGLELINLGPAANARAARVFTVDCQLNRLSEVKVTGATL